MKINKVQSRGRVSEGSTLPETLASLSLSYSFGNSCITLFLPPFALPYLPLFGFTSPLPSLTSLCLALPPHVLPYLALVLPYIHFSWFTSSCPALPPLVLPYLPLALRYPPLSWFTSSCPALPPHVLLYQDVVGQGGGHCKEGQGWDRAGDTVKRARGGTERGTL